MSRKQAVSPPVYRYYMLNKPAGCVSACRDRENPTVLDCVPPELRENLFPIGRLDKYTEGLLLLTNDGKLNRWLLEPEHHVRKTYRLWAMGRLTPENIHAIQSGMKVKGIAEPLRPAELTVMKEGTLREAEGEIFPSRRTLIEEYPDEPAFCAELTLTEGKRHQIKRMLEAVECTVVSLKRMSFGGIRLDETLPKGQLRPLTEEEIRSIQPQTP